MSTSRLKSPLRFAPRVEGLEQRLTPSSSINAVSVASTTGDSLIAVYSTFGSPKLLNVINFAPGFSVKNVTVATGDVNGDGFDDVVAAVGPGSNLPSLVRVFLGSGTTTGTDSFSSQQTTSIGASSSFDFLAFGQFTGGVSLAVGNVDPSNDIQPTSSSDGAGNFSFTPGRTVDEIVVGVGSAGLPLINVFQYNNATPIDSGFALNPAGFPATKGITLATGDLNGDGFDEIIVGFRDGPLVRVFKNENTGTTTSTTTTSLTTFATTTTTTTSAYTPFQFDNGAPDLLANFVFQPSFFSTGFYVAAGDETGDGIDDIILGNIEGGSTSAVLILPTLFTKADSSISTGTSTSTTTTTATDTVTTTTFTPASQGTFNGVDTNAFKVVLPVGLGTGAGLPVAYTSQGFLAGQVYTDGTSPSATGTTTQVPDNVALGYTQNFDTTNLTSGATPTPLFDFGNPQGSGIPDFFRLGFFGGVNVG